MQEETLMDRIALAKFVVPTTVRSNKDSIFSELTRTVESAAQTCDQFIARGRPVPKENKEFVENQIALYENYCKAIKNHKALQDSEIQTPAKRSNKSMNQHMVDVLHKYPV